MSDSVVIIPTYNEKENIEAIIRAVFALEDQHQFDVLVIDDNSPDGTAAIVEKMIEPYKGKIIYMDVWGTWCQPCVQAIKASPTLKDAVKDYDVVYLYFEYGSPESAWKSAIADLNLIKPNYVHYQLPSEQQEAVIKYLKVDGFPSYFLFDKNGNMEPLDRGHIGDIDGFKKKIEEISKK